MTSVFGGTGITRSQAAGIIYPATTLRSGLRVGMPPYASALNTVAVASDVMYAYPIPIPARGVLRGVAIQVGTAVAGVSAKLGIAAPGPDGLPATLIAECPTPVDCNSAAGTELLADFSSSITRGPEPLWGLCVFNGLAQPCTIGAFNAGAYPMAQWIGATHICSLTTFTAPGVSARLSRAHTYANAFPATLTGWSVTTGTNPSSPIMCAVTA